MCKKLLVLVMVLAFVGAAQAALFTDGFESGDFSGWTGWTQTPPNPAVAINSTTIPSTVWWNGGTVTNADAYEGSYSADFVAGAWWSAGGGAFDGILGDFGGVSVSMSAYAKVVSSSGGIPGGIDMVFYAGIPDETTNNPPSLGRVDLHISDFGLADARGWQYGLLTTVAPAGTTYMKFEIECMTVGGTESGEVLFDNVVGTPEPATMILLGLGSLALLKRRKS